MERGLCVPPVGYYTNMSSSTTADRGGGRTADDAVDAVLHALAALDDAGVATVVGDGLARLDDAGVVGRALVGRDDAGRLGVATRCSPRPVTPRS